jgi:membrane carboxypeptidase/penicillin-binding protein
VSVFVNTVWLGTHNGKPVRGFAEAAEAYCNKPFNNVTLDEYLSLVAMVIAPAHFHVKQHPQRNADRVRRIKGLLAGEYKPSGLMDLYYDKQ